MDFFAESLENQNEMIVRNKEISAFGVSLQGASHLEQNPPVPCQDAHDMRWLDTEGILIAAIADGVGSCALSHWGSRTAVNSALDSVQNALVKLAKSHRLRLTAEDATFRRTMKAIMLEAFRTAQAAVENLADSGQPPQPVFAFQSTLTLVIYDGDCLFHGHVGDDGIVAQLPDGTVEMATRRVKGEEANSVFPLQSGEQFWLFGVVPHVAGFVMATDGVLDSFVAADTDNSGKNYFSGICYAFMEEAIYTLAGRSSDAPQRALNTYKNHMLTDSYRTQVADDLTLLVVVSPKAIHSAKRPKFSINHWKQAEEQNRQALRQALYGKQLGTNVSPSEEASKVNNAPTISGHKMYPSSEKTLQQKNYPRSPAFEFMKGILVTLLVLVAFAGGITLGRTLLAPIKVQDHENLQQSYSTLLETKASLEDQLEEMQTQLTEKDEQRTALEDEIKTLMDRVAELEAVLERPKNDSDATVNKPTEVPGEKFQTIQETQPFGDDLA